MATTSNPIALVDEGLGNSSYLVDLGDDRALVVDPSRDPTPCLAAARQRGLGIAFAAETHLHTDLISGSRELAALGARGLASVTGRSEFPHRGLEDGDEVDLGGLNLRALGTPGHTPEHLSYLLLDGARPVALFSGGSLLVGAVARTDLIAPERTDQLARLLWRSLRDHILILPDDLAVYATHGAGSFCSAQASAERTTTIGRERAANPQLNVADEDAFVGALLGGLGSCLPYFLRLREVNRRGPHLYGNEPPVSPGSVLPRSSSVWRTGLGSSMSGRWRTSRPVMSQAPSRSRCGTSSLPGSAGWLSRTVRCRLCLPTTGTRWR